MLLLDVLLALALVAVVPLVVYLEYGGARLSRTYVVAGVVASVSFALDEGAMAVLPTVPWIVVCLGLAKTCSVAIRSRERAEILRAIPVVYLIVGAGWLAISRSGANPLGFGDKIVELTAIHWHYAGFVASVLMLRLTRWNADTGSWSFLAVLTATPVTAAGITFASVLGAVGACMFAIGLTSGAVRVLVDIAPKLPAPASALLRISSLSVVGTMVLAVAYALGQWLGTPAPSLSTIAWTHGLLNAVGFGLAGAFGWVLADRSLPQNRLGPGSRPSATAASRDA